MDSEMTEEQLEILFSRLRKSKFRSSFFLKQKEKEYAMEKGSELLRKHAADFIRTRIAPAEIPNDGKQTPMRGHPVFVAQHATGICCRGCLSKWHHIPKGIALTREQQRMLTDILMAWISDQLQSEVELNYYP